MTRLMQLFTGRAISLYSLLQIIQNAAALLVFNQPNYPDITPILLSLNWLPIGAHIQFKSLALALRAVNEMAPTSTE